MNKYKLIPLICLLVAQMAAYSAYSSFYLQSEKKSKPIRRPSTTRKMLSPKEIFSKWKRSIVIITTDQGMLGTGFVSGNSNTIVTCQHVITGAAKIRATFASGVSVKLDKVSELGRGRDLVMLSSSSRKSFGIPISKGSFSRLQVGDRLIVIGNPEGFALTLTDGLLSAKRAANGISYLQLSVPVSHGSSGSPVFNSYGEVVGVVVGSIETGQQLNFAVSLDGAVPIMSKKATTISKQQSGNSQLPDSNLVREFYHAIKKEDIGKITTLLKKEQRLINLPHPDYPAFRYGASPLLYCLDLYGSKMIEVAKLLASKGADPNTRDNSGETPLQLVCKMPFASHNPNGLSYNPYGLFDNPYAELFNTQIVQLAELLISKGANLNTRDDSGKTLLHWCQNAEMIRLLISKGVNLNARDSLGNTPLILVCGEHVYNEAESLNNIECIKILLANGADVNAKNDGSWGPLWEAVDHLTNWSQYLAKTESERTSLEKLSNLQVSKIKILLAAGANVNAQGWGGDTPLMLAAMRGNAEIVNTLIAAGADVNFQSPVGEDIFGKSHGGSTALHEAAEGGSKDIVKILLKAGAKVNISNGEGNTPLWLARSHKHWEIADLLQQYGTKE